MDETNRPVSPPGVSHASDERAEHEAADGLRVLDEAGPGRSSGPPCDILDSLLDPIVLLDKQHRVVEMNRAAVDLLGGGAAAQPIGRTVLDVLPWVSPVVPGAGDAAIAAAAAECSVVIDGRERCFEVQYRRGADADDSSARSVLSLREVTERRNVENALRQREASLRSILRAVPTGIGQIRDGGLLRVNNRVCEMVGASRDELVGREARVLFGSDEEYGRVAREHWRQIHERGDATLETRWRHRDGREIDVLLSSTVVDPVGSSSTVTFTALDITERKRFEAEILRAREEAEAGSQAKSRFLSTVSHEIRTPLNAIVGMTEALAGTALSTRQRDYLEVCRTAGEDLLGILNDVLDISKIEAGQVELEEVPFDLIEVVERVSDVLALRAHQKGLELRTIVHPGTETRLLGDPHRLRQVLMNLVGNAVKFTEHGGVTVEVRQAEVSPEEPARGPQTSTALSFAVTDTGIGIPGEKLESIFESFTQADSSTTRRFGGTGLGLAIAQRLVALMGGTIEVDSRLGEGSRFSFVAQIRAQSGAGSAIGADRDGADPDRAATLAARQLASARVLLAEDSASNQSVVQAYLFDSPVQVDVATNGAAAVERFKTGSYDLVLMDIEMPEMDGFAAVGAIREWERENGRVETPTVALTAHALAGLADRCIRAGFSAYIAKPIKRSEFIEVVGRCLDARTTEPRGIFEPGSRGESGRSPSVRSAAPAGSAVDPCLAPLVPGFLDETRKDLAALGRHLACRDFGSIRLLGHRIKGDGGTYGFRNLAALGARLQTAAEQVDEAAVRDLLAQLDDSLDEIDAARSAQSGGRPPRAEGSMDRYR